jgi:photosystem II stability/assembly factor-like uncharacterized protein
MAKKRKQAARRRPAAQPAAPSRWQRARGWILPVLVGVSVAAVAVALLRDEDDGGSFLGVPAGDPGPVHVHALGVDPADGSLFLATHTGLWRVGAGERTAERVGESRQDTMGFTVVGPNRFLGSGHPDYSEAQARGLPPHLGLIESADGGRSWETVSLPGEADFHVLRSAGERVYGYDSSNDRLLASRDAGRSWDELDKPGPIVDLAVAPGAADRIVVASAGGLEEGLFESRDGGGTWQRLGDAVGLLGWSRADRLYVVSGSGRVFRSPNGGRGLEPRGDIGGQPAALLAHGPDELYVALHDGTVKRSTDGGATWTLRSSPEAE